MAWGIHSRGEHHMDQIHPCFLAFWGAVNVALACRGEVEMLHGEARQWWEWRPVKRVDDRLINRIINSRKPL